MDLTKEVVEGYVGGQIEIQNSGEGYMFRGDIKSATVEGNELRVEVSWLAKGEGFPPIPRKWVKDTPRPYAASLEAYAVSDIGEGRICLDSSLIGETTVLFPKGGSRLEPSNVEGLEVQV